MTEKKQNEYPNFVARYKDRLEDFEYPERWFVSTKPYPDRNQFAQAAFAHKIDRAILSVRFDSGFVRKFGKAVRKLGGEYDRKGKGGYYINRTHRSVRIPWTPAAIVLIDTICTSEWAARKDGNETQGYGDYSQNLNGVGFSGEAEQSDSTVPLSVHYSGNWKPGMDIEDALQESMGELGGWDADYKADAEIDREVAEKEKDRREREERDQRDKEIHKSVQKLGRILVSMDFNVEFYSNSQDIQFKDKETADKLAEFLKSVSQ